MIWCLLLGHNFKIDQIGVACVKFCPRCGKSYVLAEKYNKITGESVEDHWRELKTKKSSRTA